MSDVHRLTIRLNPHDDKERSIISFLDSLDSKKYKSKNSFVIESLDHYISYLSGGNNKLLDDIRQIFREEVQVSHSVQPAHTNEWNPQLSEEESKENEQNVLVDLEMFG